MAQDNIIVYVWDYWEEKDKLYMIVEIGNKMMLWEKIILE